MCNTENIHICFYCVKFRTILSFCNMLILHSHYDICCWPGDSRISSLSSAMFISRLKEYGLGNWGVMRLVQCALSHDKGVSFARASLSRYANCGLRMRRECWERCPRHRGFAIPTCIIARAWRTCRDAYRDRWPAVSFEVGGGKNAPGIPGACATRNFTYLVKGPSCTVYYLQTGKVCK